MKRYFIILSLLVIILSSTSGFAATMYYMANNPCSGNPGWGNGSNSNQGTKASPFLTVEYSLRQMTAGDSLIIDDGIYTGNSNDVDRRTVVPYGNNGADGIDGTSDDVYSTIRAENDGKVIFTGEQFEIYGQEEVDDGGLHLDFTKKRFTIWRGLVFTNHSTGIKVGYTKRIKIINCGVTTGTSVANDTSAFLISRGTYILIEGCYVWGDTGPYVMQATHSDHVIWRNCVVRPDRNVITYAQVGGLCNYSCSNQLIQNCIVIDGNSGYQHLGNYDGTQGCFANPATSPRVAGDYAPNLFYNCIAINTNQRFGTSDHSNDGGTPPYRNYTKFYNSIGWDLVAPPAAVRNIDPANYTPISFFGSSGSSSFSQSTFGNFSSYSGADVESHVGLFHGTGVENLMTNTIIHNLDIGGLFRTFEGVNNINITQFTHSLSVASPETVVQDQTNHPFSNHFLLIVNDDDPLQTAGSGGQRIGAEILYQHGKSGTMWGETGYDKLQDGTNGQDKVKLWPFPNEDIIREYMRSYSYTDPQGIKPPINGKRGFCADGKQMDGVTDITLTSYIWEYLGTRIPTDIYGEAGSIGIPQNLRIVN